MTITGSAFDALQVAVGEENLVANGDAVLASTGNMVQGLKMDSILDGCIMSSEMEQSTWMRLA